MMSFECLQFENSFELVPFWPQPATYVMGQAKFAVKWQFERIHPNSFGHHLGSVIIGPKLSLLTPLSNIFARPSSYLA